MWGHGLRKLLFTAPVSPASFVSLRPDPFLPTLSLTQGSLFLASLQPSWCYTLRGRKRSLGLVTVYPGISQGWPFALHILMVFGWLQVLQSEVRPIRGIPVRSKQELGVEELPRATQARRVFYGSLTALFQTPIIYTHVSFVL